MIKHNCSSEYGFFLNSLSIIFLILERIAFDDKLSLFKVSIVEPKKYFNSKIPCGVDIYLLRVISETVDS